MNHPCAIVIGASAGALDALSTLLPSLPRRGCPPVMIVVHLPQDKDSILCQLLRDRCPVTVSEAQDKEPIEPAHVYLAPPGYHLLVEKENVFSLSNEAPVLYSRPSIDVLFEAAADAYGAGLTGIVLTGANSDGARGLRAVLDAGGNGIVQDPNGAEAPAMPQAAKARCPEAKTMTLLEISRYFEQLQKLDHDGGSVE